MSRNRLVHVVVVDNDVSRMFTYCNAMLQAIDVRIDPALNGLSGLAQIADKKPSLIITKLDLPLLDGFQMIRILQADPDFQHTPLIIMTNLSKQEIRNYGLCVDTITCVHRCCSIPELIQTAQRILQALPQKVRGDFRQVA